MIWTWFSRPRLICGRIEARATMALLCGALLVITAACAPAPAEGARYAIGQTAEVDGWRVTVHSFTLLASSRDRQPDPGNVFCAVEVSLENASGKTRYFMPERQMLLRDASGTVHELDHHASVLAARSRQWLVPDGDMSAGETARGAASYQVPANSEELSWVFRSGLFPWASVVTYSLGDALQ